ncbi:zinc finger protein 62 homolog isoform X2 [Ochlerotatus camptorhynchus]|uniref:zinc finger protein 62 homolog isoform X2 n=1 Tax=Ochlerotatus camptorhynchus TaxID=644619 RepID=UPI0031DE9FD9
METRSSNSQGTAGVNPPSASGPNICRVCLVNGGTLAAVPGETKAAMESIFTTVGEYEDKSLYGILVAICTPLGQREMLSGGVPERICRSCKWRLLAAYELHQTCLRSDDKLRERVDFRKKQQLQQQIQQVPEGVMIKQEVLDPDEQDFNQNTTGDPGDLSFMLPDHYFPEAESTQMENTTELLEEMASTVDPNESLFEEHYKLNDKGNHSCTICEQEFPYKSQCRSHIITKHDPTKPFKCDVCHYTLTTEIRLIRHKALTHGIGVIKIDAILDEKDDVDTVYTCQICSKTFNSLVRFKRHKNVHVAYNRPFKCDICLYRFPTRAQLTQHAKTHQEKPAGEGESGNPDSEWACEYCDEKLPGKRAQTMHVRRFHPQELLQTETREKNDYKCIICEEAFARESVLNTHMKMHELLAFEKEKEQRQELEQLVKKELQAQLPNKKDSANSSSYEALGANLDLSNVNVKKKSDVDVAFACMICDQEFEERELLLKHQKKLHKELQLNIVSGTQDNSAQFDSAKDENSDDEPMVVDLDPSEYSQSQSDGESTQKARSGGPMPKCDLCQKTFMYNCLLQTHIKNSHSETKPFECKVCRMRFGYRGSLQKHELTHSAQNIRPGEHGSIMYKCKICSAKFLELKALTVHLRTHRGGGDSIQPKKVEIFQCSSCPQIFQEKDKFDAHVANGHRPGGVQLQPSGSAHMRKNPDPRRVAERKPMSDKERFFGSLSIVKLEQPAERVRMETL